MSPGYVHAEAPYRAELDRLHLLERRYDTVTRGRLERVGPLTGMRCLDVGAGAGSVASMLADAVGPDGEVVALDLDPRFLTDLHRPNLTVRQHDIVRDELERSAYDLVHCRALLLHLSDPWAALRRMAEALRPGGWLVLEDADFTPFGAVPGHAASEEFDRVVRLWGQGLQDGWSFDPWFGAKLPALLAELGLVERGAEALRFQRTGGSPEAELYAVALESVNRGDVSMSLPAGIDVAPLITALRDPAFAFVDSLNVCAWGRRPMLGYLG